MIVAPQLRGPSSYPLPYPAKANFAKVGVEGSNPFARSRFLVSLEPSSESSLQILCFRQALMLSMEAVWKLA